MKKVSILLRTRTWEVADHTWALGQRTNNIFITCSFLGSVMVPLPVLGLSKSAVIDMVPWRGGRLKQKQSQEQCEGPLIGIGVLTSPCLSSHQALFLFSPLFLSSLCLLSLFLTAVVLGDLLLCQLPQSRKKMRL